MRMMLVPIKQGRPIPLDKAVVLLGRSADCDVILANSKKISRKHCCVAQIDDHFLIRDLGSLNGIRVNQRPVKSESQIKTGDEIWIGDIGFFFVPYDAKLLTTPPQAETPQASANPPGKQKPMVKIDPRQLSQDFPVAIPDEAAEFQVEESIPVRVPAAKFPAAKAPGNRPRAKSSPDRLSRSDEYEVVDSANDSSDVMEISEEDIVD